MILAYNQDSKSGVGMASKEATARIKINRLLEEAGWRFFDEAAGPHGDGALERGFIQLNDRSPIPLPSLAAQHGPARTTPPRLHLIALSHCGNVPPFSVRKAAQPATQAARPPTT